MKKILGKIINTSKDRSKIRQKERRDIRYVILDAIEGMPENFKKDFKEAVVAGFNKVRRPMIIQIIITKAIKENANKSNEEVIDKIIEEVFELSEESTNIVFDYVIMYYPQLILGAMQQSNQLF
jgi:hypothetical protein